MFSCNKSQRDALFLKFILIKNSACFGQIYCPPSEVLTLYTHQYVMLVMLTVPKVTWKSPLSAKFLGHFSPIVPPSAAGFASVASDAGGLLWRKLKRSKSLVLLQVGGLTCRWQRNSVKPSYWECSTTVEQAETQLRVVVPIEEEEVMLTVC
jgi:hypothetical protein